MTTFLLLFSQQNLRFSAMKFTLALKKLPFVPDSRQIIYVASEKDKNVTDFIEVNFHRIRDHFASKGYVFCYIPYVKEELLSRKRIHYVVPFAKTAKEAEYMVNDNFILDYMVHPENREKVTPALLYYHPDCIDKACLEAEDQLIGVTISEDSLADDGTLSGPLEEILEDIKSKQRKEKFSRKLGHIKYDLDLFDEEPRNICADVDFADDCFDEESTILIKEIEDRVNELKTKGIETYMVESMKLKFRKTALSQMHITKDYRIYLGDYFGMEIHMAPLTKAVYLLFLRHPEGIIFKYLPDYKQELMEMYSEVKTATFYFAEPSQQSVEDLTDPTKNRINEHCARIRAAFLEKFDDYLARNYYITGKRGEAKSISLPRDMVKWDNKLKPNPKLSSRFDKP